jgi:hypothetical protein
MAVASLLTRIVVDAQQQTFTAERRSIHDTKLAYLRQLLSVI